MNQVQGVIFDLDGVLVDTARFHYLAWKKLAENLGISFSHEQNEALKGVSRKESLEKILGWGNKVLTESEIEHWLTQKNNWYLEHIYEMDPREMLPGARDFLKMVHESPIKVALGSASKNAPLILDRLGVTHHFDAVIDGNRTSRSKPDPEVFQLGAEAIGLSPESVVVFEDAVAGVEAAKRAGMLAIGVGEPEVLSKADLVIPGFAHFGLSHLGAFAAKHLN